MGLTLDPGPLATDAIMALSGADRFGITGEVGWDVNQANGALVTSGGDAGDTGRIVAEVGAGTSLHFEMEVVGGGPDDLLVFYIDGVKQSETSGQRVAVQSQLPGPDGHLLMWEFRRGSGNG